MMETNSLFIISAPSGAGKTSLIKALHERVDDLALSISHTTRSARPGEQDGVDYYFIDDQQFETKIANNDFLEYAGVFAHQYGTSRSAIEKLLQSGSDVIVEIDWQGARQIRKQIPEAISIFILPPTRDTLEERLRARGQDSEETILRRMQAAQLEASHYDEYDYLVFNEDFEKALDDLAAILTAMRLKTSAQVRRYAESLSGW